MEFRFSVAEGTFALRHDHRPLKTKGRLEHFEKPAEHPGPPEFQNNFPSACERPSPDAGVDDQRGFPIAAKPDLFFVLSPWDNAERLREMPG